MNVRGHETCQQIVEWLAVIHPDGSFARVVVFVDVDLGEERLVEQSSGVVVGFEVGREAVTGQVEGVGE